MRIANLYLYNHRQRSAIMESLACSVRIMAVTTIVIATMGIATCIQNARPNRSLPISLIWKISLAMLWTVSPNKQMVSLIQTLRIPQLVAVTRKKEL